MTGDAIRAETLWLAGAVDAHDERGIEAYLAQPLDRAPCGGVVVIHHMPGYDEQSREITRNLAAGGLAAICPNLYSREGAGKSAKEIFALAMAQSGVPDDRLVSDVALAAARLRRASLLQRKGRCHRVLLGRPAGVDGGMRVATRRRRRLLRGVRRRIIRRPR